MGKTEADVLLSALTEAGIAVAIVSADGAVSANEAAARLPDVLVLARGAALREPITLRSGETTWEVRAVSVSESTVVIGREVTVAERLRVQLRAADELLSFAAHELKGPLHVIGMACHLIETRARCGQPVEETNLQQLRRQVAKLARLINELLDFSRAREGRIELVREPIDLIEIARAAARHAAETRPADVRVEAPPGQLVVPADRIRVTEVIDQLVDNALRFTPSGTRIEVTVAGGRQPLVTVADRGPGVSPSERPKLFEPHIAHRGEARAAGQGLGLGLHIAREIARLHGGDLEFSPVKPSGASFTLRLPR